MMPADIQIFDNQDFGKLRTVLTSDGDIWFAARDVAKALGFRDANQVTRHLDVDEMRWSGKVVSERPLSEWGISQSEARNKDGLRLISEPGFYRVVLKSLKPQAAPFQRWVTHEVIPAIRKSGGYMVAREDESDADLMARALLVAQETIRRREQEADELRRDNARLMGKADFYDKVISADGMISVTDAAKLLMSGGAPIRPKHLTALLRDDGMLEKRTRKATSKAIERGYLRERLFTVRHSDGTETVSHYGCLTAKGLDWCRRRYGLHLQDMIDFKESHDGKED